MTDSYENTANYDFDERLDYARKGKLDEYSEQFLDDIEEKHDKYGDKMYWSENQESLFQMLAVRGGWRYTIT